MIATGPVRPKPYQKEGVYMMEDFDGRALLADEMGLGKTLQVLWYLKRNPECFPALVVCPANVKYVWEQEALVRCGLRSEVMESQTPPRGRIITKPQPLIIINYDILQYWVKYIKRIGVQTMVVDECHFLQNRDTKRTKSCKSLSRTIPHFIACSGTPLTNRPAELWPTLNMIRPDVYNAFWPFAHEFCGTKRTPWGWEHKGATNLPKLHRKLKRTCMIRRLKKDVLSELPPKLRHVIPVPLTDPEEYNRANTDFYRWLRQTSPTKAKKAKKALAMTRLGYLLRLAAKLKSKAVVRWIDSFLRESDEKIVLMAYHKKFIQALHRRYHNQAVLIDGSVDKRKRRLAVDQFQRDPKTRVFIGNIMAAGVGITLTASSNLVFGELYWRPGDHTQAEDRIHRISQEKQAQIYYMVAHGTIEEKLCSVIQKKQEVIQKTLDGSAEDFDLDVFDQLIQAMGRT